MARDRATDATDSDYSARLDTLETAFTALNERFDGMVETLNIISERFDGMVETLNIVSERPDTMPVNRISAEEITAALQDHPDMVSVRSFMGKWGR